MAKKVVAIGKQSFESVIENDNFYVDKTFFIKCNKEVLICVQYLKKQGLKEDWKEDWKENWREGQRKSLKQVMNVGFQKRKF